MNTDREKKKKKVVKQMTQVNLGNTKAMRELHAYIGHDASDCWRENQNTLPEPT
jgi:hypothetical protein